MDWPMRVTTAAMGAIALFACTKTNPEHGDDDEAGTGTASTTTPSSTSTTVTTTTASTTASATASATTDGSGTTTGGPANGWEQTLSLEVTDPVALEVLTDVPILVRFSPQRFAYADAAAEGSDLRFYDADEGTLLAHEIEHWNPVGFSFVWVRIPEFDTDAEIELRLEYATPDPPAPLAPNLVWSNGFLAVWHFAPNADPSILEDSSGLGNHLVVGDAEVTEKLDESMLGYAVDVPDTPPQPTLEDDGQLDLQGSMTLEAWVRPATTSTLTQETRHREVLARQFCYRLCAVHYINSRPFFGLTNLDPVERTQDIHGNANGPETLSVNDWAYLVGTYGDDELFLYVDGQLGGQETFLGPRVNNSPLQLGRDYSGDIDEARLSGEARSAAWVDVQYQSMTDTLVTFGNPTPRP